MYHHSEPLNYKTVISIINNSVMEFILFHPRNVRYSHKMALKDRPVSGCIKAVTFYCQCQGSFGVKDLRFDELGTERHQPHTTKNPKFSYSESRPQHRALICCILACPDETPSWRDSTETVWLSRLMKTGRSHLGLLKLWLSARMAPVWRPSRTSGWWLYSAGRPDLG